MTYDQLRRCLGLLAVVADIGLAVAGIVRGFWIGPVIVALVTSAVIVRAPDEQFTTDAYGLGVVHVLFGVLGAWFGWIVLLPGALLLFAAGVVPDPNSGYAIPKSQRDWRTRTRARFAIAVALTGGAGVLCVAFGVAIARA